MAQQETIDRDLRLLLGDLQVQLIFAKSRITELEELLAAATRPKPEEQQPVIASKANGSKPVAEAGAPG